MIAPRVLISASAGSGKTYKLVHHFLGVMYDGLLAPNRDRQPQVAERILTATFTRSAAGEIIDRILGVIANAMLDPKKRQELCTELGAADLGEKDCASLLRSLVTALHRLRVCTLDSFLVRSAQAFSTELGLPARWTILDDAADQSACLEAVDQILTEKSGNPADFAQMLDLIIMLNQQRLPLQVRDRLVTHLKGAEPALSAGPPEAWEAIAPDPDDLLGDADLAHFVANFSIAAEPFIPKTAKTNKPNGNWVNAIVNVAEAVHNRAWEKL